jgi:hypothetical protein
MPPAFPITLSKATLVHLNSIDRKFHRALRDELLEQLSFEPFLETRNRKPLDPSILGVPSGNCGVAQTTDTACSTNPLNKPSSSLPLVKNAARNSGSATKR